jgi:predicted dehydrogenase
MEEVMTERVRVGVVGTSRFAEILHLAPLQSHPDAEIVALCGRNREHAEQVATKYGITQVVTDWRDLIERGNLQALVVATPDDLHHPITMAALGAGLHVSCEKPLALTASDAEAMYREAEAKGVKHMTFFTYRWMPHWRYVQQLIDEGYIGRPCHVTGSFLAGFRHRAQQYGWRFDRRRANGVLGDFGPHMIDLLRLLVGDISAISAALTNFGGGPGLDGATPDLANDSAALALRFANGTQGTLQLSAVANVGDAVQRQQFVLHGEDGTLEADFDFLNGAAIRGARRGEARLQPLPIPADLLGIIDLKKPPIVQSLERLTRELVGDRLFIDAILADQPLSPSFYDGWKAQQVIQAALESNDQGRWVTIE